MKQVTPEGMRTRSKGFLETKSFDPFTTSRRIRAVGRDPVAVHPRLRGKHHLAGSPRRREAWVGCLRTWSLRQGMGSNVQRPNLRRTEIHPLVFKRTQGI